MMKYQLKLVTMYMAHRARTFRFVKILRQGTPWCPTCGVAAHVDQISLGLVGGRMLVRVIAKPEVEHDAPDAGEGGEQPESLSPRQPTEFHEQHPGQRSKPTHETGGQPDRTLGDAALTGREPVVESTSDIRERPRFSHSEHELGKDEQAKTQ